MKEVYENKNLDTMKENIRRIEINTIEKYNETMFNLIQEVLVNKML